MQTRTAVIGGIAALVMALVIAVWMQRSPDSTAEPAAQEAPRAAYAPPGRHAPATEAEAGKDVFVPGSGLERQAAPAVPVFVADTPEDARAAATAQRIQDNVLSLFDAAIDPDYTADVEVQCSADGRKCKFDAPYHEAFSRGLLTARSNGDWADKELEGITFEDFNMRFDSGERRFSVVARAP